MKVLFVYTTDLRVTLQKIIFNINFSGPYFWRIWKILFLFHSWLSMRCVCLLVSYNFWNLGTKLNIDFFNFFASYLLFITQLNVETQKCIKLIVVSMSWQSWDLLYFLRNLKYPMTPFSFAAMPWVCTSLVMYQSSYVLLCSSTLCPFP